MDLFMKNLLYKGDEDMKFSIFESPINEASLVKLADCSTGLGNDLLHFCWKDNDSRS